MNPKRQGVLSQGITLIDLMRMFRTTRLLADSARSLPPGSTRGTQKRVPPPLNTPRPNLSYQFGQGFTDESVR